MKLIDPRLLYIVAGALLVSLVGWSLAYLSIPLLWRLFMALMTAFQKSPFWGVALFFLCIALVSVFFTWIILNLLMLMGKLFIRWQLITPAQYARSFCRCRWKKVGLEQDSQQAEKSER